MIVSHKHRFIFIHSGRTAGRSLTHALAAHCGPQDVITQVRDNGYSGQNDAGFRRHQPASSIRGKVDEKVWNEYFKFTIERNPWDKTLSRYWSALYGKNPRLRHRISSFFISRTMTFPIWFRMKVLRGRTVAGGVYHFPKHYPMYTEEGQVIVDFIGRFENRREHLQILSDHLKVPIDPDVRIGTATRKDHRPYTECYDEWMQGVIADYFREDLDLLGYRFGEAPPTAPLWFTPEGMQRAA